MTSQAHLRRLPSGARLLPVSMMALLLAIPASAQQTTPPPAAAAPAAPAEPKKDDTIVLSPFVVSTSKDTGYYAANTLAGSRMNTNIADLGAAISVVTKQQMEDTGSLDINDVFRYEINTEGSGTYFYRLEAGEYSETLTLLRLR